VVSRVGVFFLGFYLQGWRLFFGKSLAKTGVAS